MCDKITKDQERSFIAKRLSGKKRERLALVMVGGPGSGKSLGKSITLQKLGFNQNDFVNIDPDEILQSLFKFDNRCRPEINALNNKSFDIAIKNNYNLVFDVTGKNFDSYFPNVIQRLKRHRYKVYICIVLNKVNVALTRIKLRQIQTGRHVSEDFTRMVYSKLKKAIPKYIAIGCSDADGIYIYDNTSNIQLIYKSNCDKYGKKHVKCYIRCNGKYKYVEQFCSHCKTHKHAHHHRRHIIQGTKRHHKPFYQFW